MTVSAINTTKNRNQGSVPWTKRLGTMHLAFSMTCKEGADQRNVIIIELRRFGVGRESFTVQNVHESVL
jgi:hypothetical protein